LKTPFSYFARIVIVLAPRGPMDILIVASA
jgi:hypothetical protein